ncbi:flagellar hook-length control protein FliK [Geodermatophilus sp. SYSU D00708]
MTTPAVTAAPLPATPAAPATAAPGGAERFASALDDAVADGRGGARDRATPGEVDGSAETPAGDAGTTAPDEQAPADAPVLPAGMPPGLWALLTGLGPGAAAPTPPGQAAASAVPGVGALSGAGAPPGPAATAGVVPAGAALPGGGTPAGTVPLPTAPSGAGVPAAALPGATPSSDGLPGAATAPPAAQLPAGVVPVATGPVVGAGAALPPGVVVVIAHEDGTPAPSPPPAAAAAPATAPADHAVASGPVPAATEEGEPVAASPATGLVAPGATPTAPVGAAAAPGAQPAPAGTQVAQHVAVLRNGPDGAHTMTVVLTPEALGTVEVQVTLTNGAVDLTLRGATEAGRAALLDSLPDLRRDLQSAGLTCTNASVDRDPGSAWTSAQQQAAGQQGGRQGPGNGWAQPRPRSADTGEGRPAPAPTSSASTGVDVRV